MARITNEQIMNMFNELKAENAELRKELKAVKIGKSVKNATASTVKRVSSKKDAKKKAPKAEDLPFGTDAEKAKSAEEIKKAEQKAKRNAYLTAKYGDLEVRKEYITIKNAVAAEMLAEAKASGKYWSKEAYKIELKKRTDARVAKVNGKEAK